MYPPLENFTTPTAILHNLNSRKGLREKTGSIESYFFYIINYIDFFLFTASATTIEKKRMSRRQRKNVKKRGKESENLSTTTTNNSSNCSGGTGNGNPQEGTKNQKKRSSLPSKFYVSLGLNDDQIYYHLLNYILDQDTLRSIGS